MKDLLQAMRRLERSQTALTRKRARRAVKAAYMKLLEAFPPMTKEGEERIKAKRPCCPLCRIPCKSWSFLAKHLKINHCQINPNGTATRYCPACGKRCRVAHHLAALHRSGKLLQHVVAGASEHAFGGKP